MPLMREDGEATGEVRSRLHMACRMDRANVVKLLIRDGVDVDRRDEASGKAALHIAAQLGHDACVQQLLASRADVDAPDAHGTKAQFTRLHDDKDTFTGAYGANLGIAARVREHRVWKEGRVKPRSVFAPASAARTPAIVSKAWAS